MASRRTGSRDPARRRTSVALLLLTASSGVVDAVTYLVLHQVFAANMTGNVLFIGFALGGADVPLLDPAVALAAFVVGAVVAGRAVPHRTERVVPRSTVAVLVVVTVAVAVTCAGWLVVPHPGRPAMLVGVGLLAALSGAQAAAVKPLGNADVTTVVVTGTLVNLARDSRLAGAAPGHRGVVADRLLAVVAIAAGAALGAVLVGETSAAVALGASVVLRAAAVAVLVAVRRAQPGTVAAVAGTAV